MIFLLRITVITKGSIIDVIRYNEEGEQRYKNNITYVNEIIIEPLHR